MMIMTKPPPLHPFLNQQDSIISASQDYLMKTVMIDLTIAPTVPTNSLSKHIQTLSHSPNFYASLASPTSFIQCPG